MLERRRKMAEEEIPAEAEAQEIPAEEQAKEEEPNEAPDHFLKVFYG